MVPNRPPMIPSRRGRPSQPAELVATVLVLQSLEGLSDRDAVQALRNDLRWKVVVGLATLLCGSSGEFGRWGHEHDDWSPDVIVSAKGLGGGYVPLSMVSASNQVLDPITEAGNNVMFFTFSGHDASLAGALVVLDILERERLTERAVVVVQRLRDGLSVALDGVGCVVEVRGRGAMVGVELDGIPSSSVVAAALDRNVWISPAGSGPAVNDGLLDAPPFVIDDADIDRIVEVTADSIAVVATGS